LDNYKPPTNNQKGGCMKCVLVLAAAVVAVAVVSCGKVPTSAGGDSEQGNVCLNLLVIKPSGGALAKTSATVWDSIVVTVSASDMVTVRQTIKADMNAVSLFDTLQNVSAGSNRKINVITKTAGGTIVHTSADRTVDLAAGETKTVSFVLSPQSGSIYIDLSDIPTTVDSVWAVFISGAETMGSARDKRISKQFMSIDYIPDGASGILYLYGYDVDTHDTLYRSQIPIAFSVNQNITVSATFSGKPTIIVTDIAVQQPGVTVVAGGMLPGDTIGKEYGPLIMTEIMYAVDDSEYIELYNFSDHDTTLDTMIISIDGVDRKLPAVSVKSKSYLVVGRRALPWANMFLSTASALNLSSTTGNWLSVKTKTGRLMDWMAYACGTNNQQWPKAPGNASIVLDSQPVDPAYNNYGMNWTVATARMDSLNYPLVAQYGTPGKPGK
jgi:hypothetical protein